MMSNKHYNIYMLCYASIILLNVKVIIIIYKNVNDAINNLELKNASLQ